MNRLIAYINNDVAWFGMLWAITQALSIVVVCKEKYTLIAGYFDGHDNVPVQCCAHHPLEHV
jgi:hypothetical protein